MKQVLLSAAVSAALFAGAANATVTFDATTKMPDTATLNDSVVVYLSGSSAQGALIERGLLVGTNEGVCRAGTVHKFHESSSDNYNAYICELNTAANGSAAPDSSIPSGLGKSNLLLYKRNQGGSLQGIAPILNPANIDFLNMTDNTLGCTVDGSAGSFASIRTCTFDATHKTVATPDFGLSDVNPQIFTVTSENAPAGTSPATPAGPSATTYQIVPGPALAFGLVVNLKLRNALQEAQFGVGNACVGDETDACMPNLNTEQLVALFAAYTAPIAPLKAGISAPTLGAGKITSWTQFKVGGTDLFNNASAAYKPGSAKVHMCTRTQGSGTKAQFGVKFLNNVCGGTAGSIKVVSHADHSAIGEVGQSFYTNSTSATSNIESQLRPIVHAMGSGGDLEECLTELDSGAANTDKKFTPGEAYGKAGAAAVRWAIGFHSLDKNADRSKAFRFVKIDGVAPTLKNVAAGLYPDWVEGTFQYNVNTLTDANKKALVLEMISSFGTPSVLSFVNTSVATHSFGTSGFLAVPAKFTVPSSGAVNLAAPVNPLSHAVFPGTGSQATNVCRKPTIYSTNPANNNQGLQLVP